MVQPHAPLTDLVVVAGGGGQRLGGIDKPLSTVRGCRLIDRSLGVPLLGRRIVVRPGGRDPIGPTDRGQVIETVTERPAGGGPAAGVAAAVAALQRPRGADEAWKPRDDDPSACVVVLAADHLEPLDAVVADLTKALGAGVHHGVAVATAMGQPQWLTAVWRRPALIAAVDALGSAEGASARALAGQGSPLFVPVRRAASLDDGEDLWAEVASGSTAIGVAGPMPARGRVIRALVDRVGGLRANDGVDPDGRPATVLTLADQGPRTHASRTERWDMPWVYVGPPARPAVAWARAHLVPLGR